MQTCDLLVIDSDATHRWFALRISQMLSSVHGGTSAGDLYESLSKVPSDAIIVIS